MDTPTAELVARYLPETEVRGDLSGFVSPMSSGRAAAEFGYAPAFPWSPSDRFEESG